MKLVTAIINSSDAKEVTKAMLSGGFYVTKIGSSGGFLKRGVTTMISAVHDEHVSAALSILRDCTHGRKYNINDHIISNEFSPAGLPSEIVVGGATVLVLNIEEMHKI